jgi:beta-galactosidase
VVDHTFSLGKTRLIGSFPGYGYYHSQDARTRRFFADLLRWAGRTQHITSSDPRIIARLQVDGQSRYVWIVNATRADVQTDLKLANRWGPVQACRVVEGDVQPTVADGAVSVMIPGRDVIILELL